MRINKAGRLEWLNQVLGRLRRVAENLFQVGIGGERRGAIRPEPAQVEPLGHSLKHSRERCGALVHRYFLGGCGVGVRPAALPGDHRFSMADRIDTTSAPDE